MASRKKKPPDPPARRWPSVNLTVARRSLVVTIFVAALAGSLFLISYVQKNLRASLRAESPLNIVVTTDKPDWIAMDPAAEIRVVLERRLVPSPPSAREMAEIAKQCSWVRDVRIRHHPTGIDIQVDYREPTVGVVRADRCCYLDRDGVTLDAASLTAVGGARCLTLEGAPLPATLRVGQTLDDPEIRGACAIADSIRPFRVPLGLDRLILTPGGRTSSARYVLFSQSGGQVVWGRLDEIPRKQARIGERARTGEPIGPTEVLHLETSSTGRVKI
jgi:hypothetical protein